MNPSARTAAVKRRGAAIGFDAVGVATLERSAYAEALDRWLADGRAGTMTYLNRQAKKRKEPQRILAGARAAVVTLTNYFHAAPAAGGAETGHGRVAQYAWSTDYHRVLSRRLERLAAVVRHVAPEARTRCYVDSGPVPERELAARAGLGWIGKNTMLLNPRMGSFTFIGVVITDADLATDLPFEADRCGSCRQCLDACPTDALVEPRVLDARRCISYLTVEWRGDLSPTERAWLGEWLLGCDVCQDVCPWNVRFAAPTTDSELAPDPALAHPRLDAFDTMPALEFVRRFGDTPFERPGVTGMRRNAAAVRENSVSRRDQSPVG